MMNAGEIPASVMSLIEQFVSMSICPESLFSYLGMALASTLLGRHIPSTHYNVCGITKIKYLYECTPVSGKTYSEPVLKYMEKYFV